MMTHALIGGAIGGVLSGIPILNFLNCCFCALNMAGAGMGVGMFLKANPNERVSAGEAAGSGAISGALSGLIAGVLGLIMNVVLRSVLIEFYKSVLPPDMRRQLVASMGMGVAQIPINIALYAGFGALGGFLAMQFFYKDRRRD
jgi:phosphotransferase system  glucose/maltose/N-acetylglucosamine-specific IIC component